jgi:hypothetical protein
MYYVITEIPDNIHTSTYSYIIDADTVKQIELFEKELINYNYVKHNTLDEAKEYLKNHILYDTINYTKIINNLSVKNDNLLSVKNDNLLSVKNDDVHESNRFVIVYISKSFCVNEGYYKVKLNEYLQLKDNINIKLATNEELETITEANNTVIVHKDVWSTIKFQNPSETFYEEDSHDITLLGDGVNQKLARLLNIFVSSPTIDLIPYFRNVFGNLEEYIIILMIEYFNVITLNMIKNNQVIIFIMNVKK